MHICDKLVSPLPYWTNHRLYLSVLFGKQHIYETCGWKSTTCRVHRGTLQYDSGTEPYNFVSCLCWAKKYKVKKKRLG